MPWPRPQKREKAELRCPPALSGSGAVWPLSANTEMGTSKMSVPLHFIESEAFSYEIN